MYMFFVITLMSVSLVSRAMEDAHPLLLKSVAMKREPGRLLLEKVKTYAHPIQPVIKNGRFFNTEDEGEWTNVVEATKIFAKTWTSFNKYRTPDMDTWVQKDEPFERSVPLRVQWIGHATQLIQINGINIITDPVLGDMNAIYKRKTPAGIEPEAIPSPDIICLSHLHQDHACAKSFKLLLAKNPEVIVLAPLGTGSYFEKLGFKKERVLEHGWWQKDSFKRNELPLQITFVPAVHWSGLGMSDAQESLWGGWIFATPEKTVYFAGDTGYNEDIFKAIKKYAPTIDCALMPLGPCDPRELMERTHIDPAEAVKACTILQPKVAIPVHWGTFRLGPDSFDTPIKRLDKELESEPDQNWYKIKFGESITEFDTSEETA